ncbi:MAG: hypothetical protein PUC39_08090 [Lachnospiraceae bacterium]|nr:hypothetical protein [Lachnospiraceae bacterium]
MEFEWIPWKMDVDVEGTRDYYKSHDLSVKKKVNAVLRERLNQKQIDFFNALGVDLERVQVMYNNELALGDVKEVYEVRFLLKGTLQSLTSFQAEVYADEEVFGKKILEQVEVVDDKDFLSDEYVENNNIDGMWISFKHPCIAFEWEEFQTWDCGYICGVAVLKGREYDFSEPTTKKKTKRADMPSLPYSLHDVHIKKIKLRKVNQYAGNVTFFLKKGFYDSAEDSRRIAGNVVFEKVDFDFTAVSVLKVKGMNYGKLKGHRYSLKKFIKKYPKVDIEIVDEVYGYNSSKFFGYLYSGKKVKEVIIELYHEGGMYYMTNEDV